MAGSIRDEIQDMELDILQDYLELRMRQIYRDNWIHKIVDITTIKINKDGKSNGGIKYTKFLENIQNKGERTSSKKDMDISMLTGLLQYQVVKDCIFYKEGENKNTKNNLTAYYKYIDHIREDKNSLSSHITDMKDKLYIGYLEYQSIYNLREFIKFLDKYKDKWTCEGQEDFLCKYKTEIQHLEETVVSTNNFEPVDITIAVKDEEGSFLSGCSLQLFDEDANLIFAWDSSEYRPTNLRLPEGVYTLKEVSSKPGYVEAKDEEIKVIKDNSAKSKFEMINKKASFYITYRDSENGVNLEGAQLELLDDNDQIVDNWVTSKEHYKVVSTSYGNYKVVVKKPADGYATSDELIIPYNSSNVGKDYFIDTSRISNDEIVEKIVLDLSSPDKIGDTIKTLEKVSESRQIAELYILLACIYETGTYGKKDHDKAKENFGLASWTLDESLWFQEGEKAEKGKKYGKAAILFTAYALHNPTSQNFCRASKVWNHLVNYRFTKKCAEYGSNCDDANDFINKLYNSFCRKTEDEYIKSRKKSRKKLS